jgi:hypothetical protein
MQTRWFIRGALAEKQQRLGAGIVTEKPLPAMRRAAQARPTQMAS